MPLEAAGARLAGTAFESLWRAQGKFVIAGAGALGAEVFRTLCTLQPACIVLIDPDAVRETDLGKSWLFEPRSVGANKAYHLAEIGRIRTRETEIRAIGREFADTGYQEFADASLVFSCVDSDLARLEIALACRKLGLPVCDGGLAGGHGAGGRVSWFPAAGACFGCKLRPQRLRELLLFAQADVRSCSLAEAGGLPMTPTAASLIGSLQVDFGLRCWHTSVHVSRSVELSLEPSPALVQFENPVSAACPLHSEEPESSIAINPGTTFREVLRARMEPDREPYFALDWPHCMRARCLQCGHEWQPFLRCARLRRIGACPLCRASRMLEMETIRTIREDSDWAGFTPEQLGLPARHLFTLRCENRGGA